MLMLMLDATLRCWCHRSIKAVSRQLELETEKELKFGLALVLWSVWSVPLRGSKKLIGFLIESSRGTGFSMRLLTIYLSHFFFRAAFSFMSQGYGKCGKCSCLPQFPVASCQITCCQFSVTCSQRLSPAPQRFSQSRANVRDKLWRNQFD